MTISPEYAAKLGELNDELEAEVRELRAKVERLEAVLKQFADRSNWSDDGHTCEWMGKPNPWVLVGSNITA